MLLRFDKHICKVTTYSLLMYSLIFLRYHLLTLNLKQFFCMCLESLNTVFKFSVVVGEVPDVFMSTNAGIEWNMLLWVTTCFQVICQCAAKLQKICNSVKFSIESVPLVYQTVTNSLNVVCFKGNKWCASNRTILCSLSCTCICCCVSFHMLNCVKQAMDNIL